MSPEARLLFFSIGEFYYYGQINFLKFETRKKMQWNVENINCYVSHQTFTNNSNFGWYSKICITLEPILQ